MIPMMMIEPTINATRITGEEESDRKLKAIPGLREKMMLKYFGTTSCGKNSGGRDSIHAFVARSTNTTASVTHSQRRRRRKFMS
jgi:hypothetical protein